MVSRVACGIFVLAFVFLTSVPASATRYASPAARAKACAANMQVILGAIEMYDMDHPTRIKTLNKPVLEMLERDKYLKCAITRPEVDCSYFGTDLDKPGETTNRVRCAIHGSREDVRKFAEDYNSVQKMRTIVLWGSGVVIFLAILVSVFWGRKPSA